MFKAVVYPCYKPLDSVAVSNGTFQPKACVDCSRANSMATYGAPRSTPTVAWAEQILLRGTGMCSQKSNKPGGTDMSDGDISVMIAVVKFVGLTDQAKFCRVEFVTGTRWACCYVMYACMAPRGQAMLKRVARVSDPDSVTSYGKWSFHSQP